MVHLFRQVNLTVVNGCGYGPYPSDQIRFSVSEGMQIESKRYFPPFFYQGSILLLMVFASSPREHQKEHDQNRNG